MRTRPFGNPKANKWIKKYTHKRYRMRIKMEIYFYFSSGILDELHLSQWKDINNPWQWD